MTRFGQHSNIVGRTAELAVVSALLDAAVAGVGGLLIQGHAGIGKSMLWQAGLAAALLRGHQVLVCRPVEAEAQMSFAAITDLLDPVLADTLPHLPDPQRRGLETALLRGDIHGAADERAVAFGFLTTLRTLGRDGPVLVAIDDWQWLDTPSERVLRFALRRLADEPVALLTTVRSATGPSPEGALAEERLTHLVLEPLNLAALHQLLVDRVAASFPRHTLLKIQDAAAGNMIFAIEIGRLLAARAEPLPPGEPLPIPATLNDLVAERVAALPRVTREALLAASALGQPTLDLMASVEGMPPRPAHALAAAERAALIELDDDRLRFSHPLIAAAVYGGASAERRRALHLQLAQVVIDPEEQARHLALAADEPSAAVVDALGKAATRAHLRGAPDAAAELCELAAHATLPDDVRTHRRLAADAAEYHFVAGDRQRARQLLEQVLPTCQPGRERARVLRLLAEVRFHDDSFPEAGGLLHQALAEADDPSERATIWCGLAWVAHAAGQLLDVVTHARAALDAVTEAGHDGLLAEVLAGMTAAEFQAGHGLDEKRLQRAVALEDVTRRTPPHLRPSVIFGVLMSWSGRTTEAQESLERLRTRLLDLGDESTLPLLAWIAAPEACERGDLAAAERHGREGLEAAAWLDTKVQRAYALTASAYADAYAGRTDPALRDAERALDLFEQVGGHGWVAWPLFVLGFTHLSRDDPIAAADVLRPWLDGLTTGDIREPTRVPFVPTAVEALIMIGDLTTAEPLLDWFEEQGERLDRPWAQATAGRCRGLLHGAHGHIEAALDTLTHAVTIHQRLRQPVEEGRTLLALGQLQRRARQRRNAHGTLERAAQIFTEVGATQWLRRVEAELPRLGLQRSAGPDLTPREQQVAELAVAGATNSQIAATLYISTKTVEANLARIYRKFDVSSRVELSARMMHQIAPTEHSTSSDDATRRSRCQRHR